MTDLIFARRINLCVVSALAFVASTSPTLADDYVYDTLGRVTAVGYSAGNTVQYRYDAAGNRIQKTYEQPSLAMRSWEALELPHTTGTAESDGWSVNVSSPLGAISYGPYVSDISEGSHLSVWRLMIDNNTADNGDIVSIDVFDATSGAAIASRTLTRRQWSSAWYYEHFYLPFTIDSTRIGHQIEMRTFNLGHSYVKESRVGLDTMVDTDTAPTMTQNWEAESNPHIVGFADADGWASSVTTSPGFMLYGPYTTSVSVGQHTAIWRMLVDNNSADRLPIVKVDVFDATAGKLLAETKIFRIAWNAPNTYQYFGLPFSLSSASAGHAIEFRVEHFGRAYVRVDKLGYR